MFDLLRLWKGDIGQRSWASGGVAVVDKGKPAGNHREGAPRQPQNLLDTCIKLAYPKDWAIYYTVFSSKALIYTAVAQAIISDSCPNQKSLNFFIWTPEIN